MRAETDVGPDVLSTSEAGGLLIRGSVLRVAGYLLGVVLLAAASVLLLRHLGVVRFGQYVTVMSVVAIASAVADAGLSVVGSRELTLRAQGEDRRELLANLLGLRLVIAPLGVIGAVAFCVLAGYPQAMVIGSLLAGGGLMLTIWQSTLTMLPIVELQNGRVTANETAKQVITVIGIAVLVAAGASLTPFLAVPVAVGIVIVALSPLILGRGAFVPPRRDRAVWSSLIREALPIAAVFILATLYLRIVVVLMSLIASAYQTGLFSTSFRILETLILIPTLLAGIALPLFTAAARDDHARLRYALQRATEAGVLGGTLVVVVVALAADTIVTVLGGAQYSPAADVLRIQSCALLGIFLSQFWSAALIALHRQRELVRVNAVALITLAVLAAVLIPAWGAKGGALATVLGEALLSSLLLWRLRRAGPAGQLNFAFAPRVLAAAAAGLLPALVPGLWEPAAATIGIVLFLGVAALLGAIPEEIPAALRARRR